MKKIFCLALLLPMLAQALPSNQVLVLTTSTRVDTAQFAFRSGGVFVQNNGPNAIFCRVGDATGLAVGYGHKLNSGDIERFPLKQGIPVYCITSVNQVAGAATDVTEF
jgi:hypothetical protein